MLFGYNSNVAFETSIAGVREQAENLLNRLSLKRRGATDRPIIFIAHSLGGIVVKRALVEAKLNDKYNPIRNATYGIAFFGTPHRGGNHAELGDIAARVWGGVVREPRNDFMEALKKDSLFSNELIQDFRSLLEDYYVLSFYETKPFKKLGLIVDKQSATLGLAGTREQQIAMEADHASVCKFASPEDDNYEQVAGNIIELVEAATKAYAEKQRLADLALSSQPVGEVLGTPFTAVPGSNTPKALTEQEMQCMRSLYSSDYKQHKERNPKRVPGTCEWFLQHPKYVNWLQENGSQLLWISADAGCGKSVLASFLVEKLYQDISDKDTIVCYFFFKDDNTQQRTSSSAFSALVHQAVASDRELIKHAMNQYELKGPRFAQEFATLWDILVAITVSKTRGKNLVCILDGLDECDKLDRVSLIGCLERFYSKTVHNTFSSLYFLKFLITSRPGVLVEDTFFDLPTIRLRAEDETAAISHDIELVVEATITSIGRRRRIPVDQQAELVKQIIGNADRTFLWVTLVLQRITTSERFNRESLKELIKTIPPDLDGVYNKILSESSKSAFTRKLLQIVVGAFRPLSLEEVNAAFVIRSTDRSEEDLDLEPDIESTVKSLCGIFLRVIDSTIYLAHQTAREFLLAPSDKILADQTKQKSVGPWKHSFDPIDTHRHFAQICNWYLLFRFLRDHPLVVDANTGDAFKKGMVDEYTKQHALLAYVARFWPDHFRVAKVKQNDPIQNEFLWLYKTDSKSFRTWFQVYWNAIYNFSLGPTTTTPLVLAAYFGHTEVVKKLLSSNVTGLNRFKSLFLKIEDDPINASDADKKSALTWAAQGGHTGTVRFLLEQRNINANHKDSLLKTPLNRAAYEGHLEIVQVLLQCRDIIADSADDRWSTPLSAAAAGGHATIAELLMDRNDVNINNKDRFGCTPLWNAALGGSVEIVRSLLYRRDIEIDFQNNKVSPLSTAARKGNLEIFQLLLERARSHPKGFNMKGPLQDAAKEGSAEIFELLLNADKSLLNCRDEDGQTPLCIAARWGKLEIVKILLKDPGIDINPVDNFHRIPLTWSICWAGGSPEIADLLLAREGILADHVDRNGFNPVAEAARAGQHKILESLLKRNDVNVNNRDPRGFTPLMWAAERGHAKCIELLFAREDVDANAQENSGMTALAWAAYMGVLAAVRLFVDNRTVDLGLMDNEGKNPLIHAANRGHKEAKKMILHSMFMRKGLDLNQLSQEQKAMLRTLPPQQLALLDLDDEL